MRKITYVLLLMVMLPYYSKSQILPKEDSKLNYRIIGFSFPASMPDGKYKIELAAGNYNTENSFKKNIIKTIDSKTNKIVAEVPLFGRQYTWRIIYKDNHSKPAASVLHHFSTTMIPYVDTTSTRLRIVHPAEKYEGAYVFLDGSRTLYDMKGSPVWYLPDVDRSFNKGTAIRDLKHTLQGTITFLAGDQLGFNAYEVNYNGDILWKGPNNSKVGSDTIENYHHEFTRLSNGHYMILGAEWADVLLKITAKKDSSLVIGAAITQVSDSIIKISRKPFGTLIEYDEKGNVVWHYKSSSYFNGSDLIYHKSADGSINASVHDNSFFFDEKDKTIYMSFKDLNRIIKISYPEGKTINTYGEIYKHDIAESGNDLFCNQHCCKISEDGYLYLFDNNSCNVGANPKLIMMQEPALPNGALKKIWEYQCTNEGLTEKQQRNLSSVSGGSVLELPDHSIFACMGNMHGKVFLVAKDKKILWSAVPETWDVNAKEWILPPQYRADIITSHAELEKIIWSNEIR